MRAWSDPERLVLVAGVLQPFSCHITVQHVPSGIDHLINQDRFLQELPEKKNQTQKSSKNRILWKFPLLSLPASLWLERLELDEELEDEELDEAGDVAPSGGSVSCNGTHAPGQKGRCIMIFVLTCLYIYIYKTQTYIHIL